MTTPSRAAEIRRTRTRRQKVSKLRRRFQAASSEAERQRILEKVRRVGSSVTQFLETSGKDGK